MRDGQNPQTKPVILKDEKGKPMDVYAAAIFQDIWHFGSDNRQKQEWNNFWENKKNDKTESDIKVAYNGAYYEKQKKRSISPTHSIWQQIPHYNKFERGVGEWAGVEVLKDTKELHIFVDFSLLVHSGNAEELFITEPVARRFQGHDKENNKKKFPRVGYPETPTSMYLKKPPLFSAVINNVYKEDGLLLKWEMDWDYLDKVHQNN